MISISAQLAAILISIAPMAFAGDGSPVGTFGIQRVLIIGIVGVRGDSQLAANPPNMDALSAVGAIRIQLASL